METAGDAHDDRDVSSATGPSPRPRGEGAAERRMRGAILQASPLTRRIRATLSPLTRGEGPLLILLLLALALPAQAQERFLIERIDVQHLVHASADVIRAESRLREGERYDESEVRGANNRIRSE